MIDYQVVGDKPILTVLEALAKYSTGKEALQTAGNAIVEEIRLGFHDGQDPWEQPWKPLSPNSRAGQPLRDTGALANSITTAEPTDTSIKIGTALCYGIVHQYGAKVVAGKPTGNIICGYVPKGAKRLRWSAGGSVHYAKSVTIPPRPFMPIKGGAVDVPVQWAGSIIESMKAEIEAAKAHGGAQ